MGARPELGPLGVTAPLQNPGTGHGLGLARIAQRSCGSKRPEHRNVPRCVYSANERFVSDTAVCTIFWRLQLACRAQPAAIYKYSVVVHSFTVVTLKIPFALLCGVHFPVPSVSRTTVDPPYIPSGTGKLEAGFRRSHASRNDTGRSRFDFRSVLTNPIAKYLDR